MERIDLTAEGLEQLAEYFTPFELKRLIEDGARRHERERIQAKARKDFERQLRELTNR